jgi:hypothetical protein
LVDPDGRFPFLPFLGAAFTVFGVEVVDIAGPTRREGEAKGRAIYPYDPQKANCFRHCYGACTVASVHGPGFAEMLDWRERDDWQGLEDQANNEAGRQVCEEYRDRQPRLPGGYPPAGPGEGHCIQECVKKVEAGDLSCKGQ